MTTRRPNILLILSDDHASHAISAYGSVVTHTPHIDAIAERGRRVDNCFCTNSVCTPSRASILTGMHSHRNGVTTQIGRASCREREESNEDGGAVDRKKTNKESEDE